MKYFIFFREDNDFTEILNDKILKKVFKFKIKFLQHLILGTENIDNEIVSYITLKYGDDLKNKEFLFIDRTPLPYQDYIPKKLLK
jgi:hypothetical protein